MAKEKKPRAAKAAKPKKPAAKKKPDTLKAGPKFNSPVNEEDRALFLNHLPKIAELKAKLNTANANLRNAYKTAKSDGFLKDDFEIAFQMQADGGEKNRKAAIARQLTIAKWLGCDLGAQLDMFVADERVPAADRAYEEGVTDCMQNVAAKPNYAPDTEQYRRYMAGFHDTTEKMVKKGIKKLHPAVEADAKDVAAAKVKTAKQRGDDEKVFDKDAKPPTSGTPVSREDYKKMQAQTDGAGDLKH